MNHYSSEVFVVCFISFEATYKVLSTGDGCGFIYDDVVFVLLLCIFCC